MMSKKGNKCGQKHFCKMMKQGQNFFHKFMKQAHKGKGKGVPPMFAGFFDQFKGKGGGCPFKKFKEAMKKNCAKKPETPVEAMTYDEQLAHAMKLSMANTKTEEKPEEPKVPEKKETKEVETPKTPMTTETPRAPSEMSFE